MPTFEKVVIIYSGEHHGAIIAVVPLLCDYDSVDEDKLAREILEDSGGDYYEIIPLDWSIGR